jgi:transcriptional regulator with XRE-family HTH domain
MHESNRLSIILYENNITYRELSRLSGISVSTLNKIANFKSDPKQSTMVSIAHALKMDVVDVFNLNWRYITVE